MHLKIAINQRGSITAPFLCLGLAESLILVHWFQVKVMVGCVSNSWDRVELVVTLYERLLDKENLWIVLYALRSLEQSQVGSPNPKA